MIYLPLSLCTQNVRLQLMPRKAFLSFFVHLQVNDSRCNSLELTVSSRGHIVKGNAVFGESTITGRITFVSLFQLSGNLMCMTNMMCTTKSIIIMSMIREQSIIVIALWILSVAQGIQWVVVLFYYSIMFSLFASSTWTLYANRVIHWHKMPRPHNQWLWVSGLLKLCPGCPGNQKPQRTDHISLLKTHSYNHYISFHSHHLVSYSDPTRPSAILICAIMRGKEVVCQISYVLTRYWPGRYGHCEECHWRRKARRTISYNPACSESWRGWQHSLGYR